MRLFLATLPRARRVPRHRPRRADRRHGRRQSVGQTSRDADRHDHARRHGGAVRLRVRHDHGLRARDGARHRARGHGSRHGRGGADRALAGYDLPLPARLRRRPGRGQDVHHRPGPAAALAAHDLRTRLHGAHGHLDRPEGADRPEPGRHDLPRGMGLLERPRHAARRTEGGSRPATRSRVALPARPGCNPYTRIYWQVVATNAAGTKRSTILTSAPAAARPASRPGLRRPRASWSQEVTVSGHVDGAGSAA